jgi:adenylylsulfate kinase-like enzyme
MVVWIIGLSGAGKTTLAQEVTALVRQRRSNVVLIDGDAIREVFGNDLGHSLEDRRRNADRICRLCKFLDDQGVNVVCAILSLFRESREWNRANLRDYYEVFIDTPMDELIARDPKGIYGRYRSGQIRDVAGMDIEFPRPDKADLLIRNDGSRDGLIAHARTIADRIAGDA